jgi:hypothetical protein
MVPQGALVRDSGDGGGAIKVRAEGKAGLVDQVMSRWSSGGFRDEHPDTVTRVPHMFTTAMVLVMLSAPSLTLATPTVATCASPPQLAAAKMLSEDRDARLCLDVNGSLDTCHRESGRGI